MQLKKKAIVFTALCIAAAALIYFAHRGNGEETTPEPEEPSFTLLESDKKAPVLSTGTISEHDSLMNVFCPDTSAADIFAIEKSLKKAGLSYIKPGDTYAVALSTAGEPCRFSIARGEDWYSVEKSTAGDFSAVKTSLPLTVSTVTTSGRISSSLWESMSKQSVPASLIMTFTDIFATKVDFLTEPRDNDSYSIVWRTCSTALGTDCGSKILAAYYHGKETGKDYAFEYKGAYYDSKGNSLQRKFLRAPLSYRRISSYFNPHRYHPILRIYRPHNGIDYAAPSGTPVSAIGNGVVVFAGKKGGYGNYIQLKHGQNFITGYGHLRAFAKGLRKGKKVKQGEVIGYVGMTGMATGPHLDFSMKKNGKFINFLKLKTPPADSLKGAKLKNFKAGTRNLFETIQAAAEKEEQKEEPSDPGQKR